jgi:hypothetical protein
MLRPILFGLVGVCTFGTASLALATPPTANTKKPSTAMPTKTAAAAKSALTAKQTLKTSSNPAKTSQGSLKISKQLVMGSQDQLAVLSSHSNPDGGFGSPPQGSSPDLSCDDYFVQHDVSAAAYSPCSSNNGQQGPDGATAPGRPLNKVNLKSQINNKAVEARSR